MNLMTIFKEIQSYLVLFFSLAVFSSCVNDKILDVEQDKIIGKGNVFFQLSIQQPRVENSMAGTATEVHNPFNSGNANSDSPNSRAGVENSSSTITNKREEPVEIYSIPIKATYPFLYGLADKYSNPKDSPSGMISSAEERIPNKKLGDPDEMFIGNLMLIFVYKSSSGDMEYFTKELDPLSINLLNSTLLEKGSAKVAVEISDQQFGTNYNVYAVANYTHEFANKINLKLDNLFDMYEVKALSSVDLHKQIVTEKKGIMMAGKFLVELPPYSKFVDYSSANSSNGIFIGNLSLVRTLSKLNLSLHYVGTNDKLKYNYMSMDSLVIDRIPQKMYLFPDASNWKTYSDPKNQSPFAKKYSLVFADNVYKTNAFFSVKNDFNYSFTYYVPEHLYAVGQELYYAFKYAGGIINPETVKEAPLSIRYTMGFWAPVEKPSDRQFYYMAGNDEVTIDTPTWERLDMRSDPTNYNAFTGTINNKNTQFLRVNSVSGSYTTARSAFPLFQKVAYVNGQPPTHFSVDGVYSDLKQQSLMSFPYSDDMKNYNLKLGVKQKDSSGKLIYNTDKSEYFSSFGLDYSIYRNTIYNINLKMMQSPFKLRFNFLVNDFIEEPDYHYDVFWEDQSN